MSKIVLYPNEILRKKVADIELIDPDTKKQIKDLILELERGENAAGLAAPQIGVSKNFFGIKRNNRKIEVFINPKLIRTWGERAYPKMVMDGGKEEDFLEGCLSFPDYFGTVKRWLKIEVGWLELKGEKLIPKRKELSGFEAIVWQHESDHLLGKLFVDYIKNEGGKFYKWNGKEMIEADIKKLFSN